MNKDIQTLREREAKQYTDYNVIMPRASLKLDDIKQYGTKSFARGAHFALSQFKWIKVSEEVPEVKVELYQIIARDKNGICELFNINNDMLIEISFYLEGYIEWMPTE